MLEEEFLRAGIESNLEEKKLIDVQNIFHKLEKRTLEAAVKFYCNKELVNAHTALADAVATLEVLKAQTVKYDELSSDVSFLSEFSKINPSSVDYAGRIVLNKDDVPVINFGKHKGKSVMAVFEKEPGYYAWIMREIFHRIQKDVSLKFGKKIKKKMKIICIGKNYANHAKEMGSKVPTEPLFFLKPDSAILPKNIPFSSQILVVKYIMK